jgi:hypothetical protein
MSTLDALLRSAARATNWDAGVVHRCAWCGRVRTPSGAYAVAPLRLPANVAVTDGMCPTCGEAALRDLTTRPRAA